ncbi:MAG: DUF1579 domain-containing protein, partial [Ignavibacteria bacterium]|nr:DUF1579 domain-containing protein [Ignavibacteria bacterium]
QDKEAKGLDQDKEAMMKIWQEVATPGESHKFLSQSVGTWETASKAWMDPSQPPEESKGTTKFTMILGGRFLQQEATGQMMGQPFKGIGIVGYDNFRKKYSMVWIDDSGTALFTAEGTSDRSGKTITFLGKMDDPFSGEKDKTVKYVSTMIDKDKQIFEIYGVEGEKEMKMMEMTYTRKK